MTRDFTVATFVVCLGHVLLLRHRALDIWLPPGGHIEPNELPDEAAVREVREETGLDVELVGRYGVPVTEPRQLIVPCGVQVERIAPDHEHIDFVYFGRPRALPHHRAGDAPYRIRKVGGSGWTAPSTDGSGQGDAPSKGAAAPPSRLGLPPLRGNDESTRVGWYDADALGRLDLTEEIRLWTKRALAELG